MCNALKFILFNTFIKFGSSIFNQIKGIPMGGNSSPLIADLYLSWKEFLFISKLTKSDYKLALNLSHNSRYIDDIATPNISDFLKISKSIYPPDLSLEQSKSDGSRDTFLDVDVEVFNNQFHTKIYHKVDDFNFKVVNMPFPDSNIHSVIGYNCFYSQLIRYASICSTHIDFANRFQLLFSKLKARGFLSIKLHKKFRQFCIKFKDLLLKFSITDNEFQKFCFDFDINCYNNKKESRDNIQSNVSVDVPSAPSFGYFTPKGFINLGNSCFLNSLLQIFVFLYHHNFLDSASYNFSNSLRELHSFNNQIDRNDSLYKFHSFLCSIENFFDTNAQQDVHEAFIKIVSNTYVDVHCVNGLAEKSFICVVCSTFSARSESFNYVSKQVSNGDDNLFYKQSTVRKFCHVCGVERLHTETYNTTNYPDILAVLISRFSFTSSGRCTKNNGQVLIHESLSYNVQQYSIFGIINHIGSTANSGHYIALIKSHDKWYKCDDSLVMDVNLNMPCNSNEAYMLFYMRNRN